MEERPAARRSPRWAGRWTLIGRDAKPLAAMPWTEYLGSYRPGRGPVNVHSFRRLQSGTPLARSPRLHETKELFFVVKLREGDHHAPITSAAVHFNPHRVRAQHQRPAIAVAWLQLVGRGHPGPS